MPVGRSANFKISRFLLEIEETGVTYRYALLLLEVTVPHPTNVRSMFETSKELRSLHLHCLHYSNEVLFQFDDRWKNLGSIPEAEQEKFEEVNPNEWQGNNVPWTHADHILSATNADVEKAELLSLAERDALFVIQFRTWSKENLVTYVRLYYPGLFFDERKTRFPEKIFCESLEIFM